ncbi:MAG: hypothetical protein EOM34_15625 [Clostridia bacterium]|nr:hypothetical protein [Clostridia bacterium]NCD03878.1 hypothetical protein [Clostridia bacterium]
MTWEEYYDKFYDWATSTQIQKISQISSFGASDEVWEVAENLFDGKAATRLIKKALINDVRFTCEEIEQMIYYIDTDVINRAFQNVKLPLTEDQIYIFDGIVDADILKEIAKKSGISLETYDEAEQIIQETPAERRKRHRKEFWDGAAETMMIDLFIDDFFGKKKR